MTVFQEMEEQEVPAVASEGHGLAHGHVCGVLGLLDDACAVHRLDQRQRRLVEERGVAGMDLEEDVVQPEAALERDYVLDHAEIVVRRARPQDEVLRARPEV